MSTTLTAGQVVPTGAWAVDPTLDGLFDADRHPEAHFEATFVTPGKVVGNFTLRGVTREIELDATFTEPIDDPAGGDRIGIELEGEINRNDYGVSFDMPLPSGVPAPGEKMKLVASLSFKQA